MLAPMSPSLGERLKNPVSCESLRAFAMLHRIPFGEAAFLGYAAWLADGAPNLPWGRPHPVTGQRYERPAGVYSFLHYMRYTSSREEVGAYIRKGIEAKIAARSSN